MSRIHYLLKEYGNYIIEHMHFADELGENILYRYAREGFTDHDIGGMKVNPHGEPMGRDKVLCPDMPARLRRVEVALNRLDELTGKVMRAWYCTPPNDSGLLPMTRELAQPLNITGKVFHIQRRRGLRQLETML